MKQSFLKQILTDGISTFCLKFTQGVKFLFFPIFSYFSQHTPIFPIFQQFPPIFPIFWPFYYNKQIFIRDLNILSLFSYVVYGVH